MEIAAAQPDLRPVLPATARIITDDSPWRVRRRRWRYRLWVTRQVLWPEIDPEEVRISTRLKRSYAGFLASGTAQGRGGQRTFWIKWSPALEPAYLDKSHRRMSWWQRRHPEQWHSVGGLIEYWPDEQVLIYEGRVGRRLDTFLHGDDSATIKRVYGAFGDWLREFADGGGNYGADIEPLLDDQARLTAKGGLVVSAREKVECRLETARRHERDLKQAGFGQAGRWADRFDFDDLLGTVSNAEAGGFIHGDVKPENVLVNADQTALIDWGAAPRVSWPVQDVAGFAASLWFQSESAAARLGWRSFAEHYYRAGINETTRRILDLLGTILCLSFLRQRACRRGVRKLVSRNWCRRNLERLIDPRMVVGDF